MMRVAMGRRYCWRRGAVAGAAGVVLGLLTIGQLSGAAMAQQQKAPQPPPNAAGAGPGWSTQVESKGQVAGATLDDKQIALVKSVSGYFNGLNDLKGSFLQTGSDNKQVRGRFYMKRPGKFRFDYAAPSKLQIISDGSLMQVADRDVKTFDEYPLESTPFRILMRKDVDLLRDARVLELQEAPDLVVLSLMDKSGEAGGKIRLFLAKEPALELKEWVITDAQGVDTRIQLGDLVKTEALDPGLFKRASGLEMPKGQN